MGLDISYYSNIKELDEFDEDSEIVIYTQEHFLYQLGSLKQNKSYSITESSEYDGFRAGSYSGYGDWRRQLANMAGYESDRSVWENFDSNLRLVKLKRLEGVDFELKPFYELINFSDCEGVIGPETSKKLYNDFVKFDDIAKEFSIYDHFYILYERWKEAFRVASNNGVVCFH